MSHNRDGQTNFRRTIAWSGDARKRGSENLSKLLAWIYQWGWTTDAVAQVLLGVKRRVAAEYARRGYLVRVEPPRGHAVAYVVAPAYQSKALDFYEDSGERQAIQYPFPRSAVPFAALGEHHERAQLVALAELCDGDLLVCDREIRAQGVGASTPVPDFIIHRGGLGGQVEWHEVELTPKYRERLLYQLERREAARQAGSFARLVWHCRTKGIARNLMAELNKPVLPPVMRRADGRIVRRPGVEGWQPGRLRAGSTVLVAGEVIHQPSGRQQVAEVDIAEL